MKINNKTHTRSASLLLAYLSKVLEIYYLAMTVTRIIWARFCLNISHSQLALGAVLLVSALAELLDLYLLNLGVNIKPSRWGYMHPSITRRLALEHALLTKGLEFPLDKVGKVGYYRRRRFYSTSKEAAQEKIMNKLNPWFVTGFTDAEGCFIITILRNPCSDASTKTGWKVQARFTISLHKKDMALMGLIKSYFGGRGNISKEYKNIIKYEITSIQDLINVIIPHFEKFPLKTQKKADYILWKKAIELMQNKEHLRIEGLRHILALKASLNLGLSVELKEAFPGIIPIGRSSLQDLLMKKSLTPID